MNSVIHFDRRVTFWFQRWPAVLHPYMLALTLFGSIGWIVGVSVVLAIVAYTRQRLRLALALAAVLPGEAFNALLKLLFNRMRPQTQFAQNMLIHTKSFPSGHAFGSTMLYGLLAYLAFTRLPHVWNWAVSAALIVLILLIGVSRIYLGAHYFLDVIGGWIIGTAVLVMVIKLTKI